jgi:hypothetical protein
VLCLRASAISEILQSLSTLTLLSDPRRQSPVLSPYRLVQLGGVPIEIGH